MPKDTRGHDSDEEDFGALTGGGDSGLGNLPPLSDFDSGDDTSDSNLPPLGKLDSDSEAKFATPGDIPSPGSIKMDTPRPTSTPPTTYPNGPPNSTVGWTGRDTHFLDIKLNCNKRVAEAVGPARTVDRAAR